MSFSNIEDNRKNTNWPLTITNLKVAEFDFIRKERFNGNTDVSYIISTIVHTSAEFNLVDLFQHFFLL